MAELHQIYFLCMLSVSVAQFSFGSIAMYNVLPVLWMTSCFQLHNGPYAVVCTVTHV